MYKNYQNITDSKKKLKSAKALEVIHEKPSNSCKCGKMMIIL